jgi:hypothetical protein
MRVASVRGQRRVFERATFTVLVSDKLVLSGTNRINIESENLGQCRLDIVNDPPQGDLTRPALIIDEDREVVELAENPIQWQYDEPVWGEEEE